MADALSRLDMLADHLVSEEEVAEMFAADAQTFMKAFPLSYEDIELSQWTGPGYGPVMVLASVEALKSSSSSKVLRSQSKLHPSPIARVIWLIRCSGSNSTMVSTEPKHVSVACNEVDKVIFSGCLSTLDLCSGVCLIALEHKSCKEEARGGTSIVVAELQPMMVERIGSYRWYEVDELMRL